MLSTSRMHNATRFMDQFNISLVDNVLKLNIPGKPIKVKSFKKKQGAYF